MISRSLAILSTVAVAVALLVSVADTWAQKKSSVRRSKFNKKELESRARELVKDYPELKKAAGTPEDNSREEIKRRALRIVDEAMSSDLRKELDAEARRVSSGSKSLSDTKRAEAEKLLDRVKAEAPPDVRKRLDKATEIVVKKTAEEKKPIAVGFDGFVTQTSDGTTLKVPGIQVASTFTGEATPVQGNGPAPGPKPAPRTKRKAKKGKVIEINCTGGAIFSATGDPEGKVAPDAPEKPPIIIFEENVTVQHPNFHITCDKLIAYMKKTSEKKEGAEKTAPGASTSGKEEEGGIERAVATGREVIVRKVAADGKVKIGKARRVTYDDDSGDVTLEIWPQVRDGDNVQLAKSADAIMILKQDGKMVTKGPTHTKIIPRGEEDPLAPTGN